ncbi:hypothetical protein H4Q26_000614 [Puccinia striiformis f. sp. tritici PST-130]|uniref:Uncharacterized protein n=2 Tax=Puccinia striiformis TaxID=27350 RepID=A0A0L0VY17_9BASI|nr:hypothetical protein H4Q26_000614 [Puccinia striiformis f. sp. tritici PST-130]KNF04156.1 hypothetical protein PSTG_02507 [Puccinia striiformis f. sp. tritici PST-78]POV96856.1 hypothetical protein PSTT_15399 [Puccinia striiformis]
MSTKLRLMMITIIFVVSILSAVKVRVLIYQLIGEVSDQSASRWIGKKGDSIPTSGDPIPTHRVKRRRGSKPGAARVTTAVIPNLRLPSPQSLLNGITDNTTDHSTQDAESGLNGQSLLQGDSKLNAVTQERLAYEKEGRTICSS